MRPPLQQSWYWSQCHHDRERSRNALVWRWPGCIMPLSSPAEVPGAVHFGNYTLTSSTHSALYILTRRSPYDHELFVRMRAFKQLHYLLLPKPSRLWVSHTAYYHVYGHVSLLYPGANKQGPRFLHKLYKKKIKVISQSERVFTCGPDGILRIISQTLMNQLSGGWSCAF